MTPKEKADQTFSRYIRRRGCPGGRGRCISCGRAITFETCDAGHYIPRTHMATRYDERNVNAQCIPCNRFAGGNMQNYRAGLIRKYGFGVPEQLEALKSETRHMNRNDFNEIHKRYKTPRP